MRLDGMTECETCTLVARRDRGEAPAWDSILRTESWDLAHASGSALEGWLVLATRRHVPVVADLSDNEAAELGPLLRRVSRALRDTIGCPKTYVAQFAEHPLHQHVHVHVIPRHANQSPALNSYRIFSLLGGEQPEVSEGRRDDLAARLAKRLGLEA